jgi:hypothetical protein
MKSKRKEMAEKRRRQRIMKSVLTWGGIAAVVLTIIIVGVTNASRPNPGEAVPVMPDTSHVAEGTDPGPFNTNPPSSGRHYSASWQSAFYDEPPAGILYPEGHLVHSLEHGYIIFWYNCELLDEQACLDTKAQIRSVMDAERMNKVIAFPWTTIDYPVVLTSWGRMLEMDSFEPQVARDFVQQNRNVAPEPNAQ